MPVCVQVPVPTTLFQGSLLLGSITRAVLGDQALRGATVRWLGLREGGTPQAMFLPRGGLVCSE